MPVVESLASAHSLPARLERWGAVALMLLGTIVICGWMFRYNILVQLRPGYAPTAFNVALCFLLAGMALLVDHRPLRIAASLAIICIGAAEFAQYPLQLDLGIDGLLDSRWIDPGSRYPGRMAAQSALFFVLIGMALLLQQMRYSSWSNGLAQTLALIVGVGSMLSLIGYSLQLDVLYSWHWYSRMAALTAAGFLLLAVTVWLGLYRANVVADEFLERAERHMNVIGTALIVLITMTAGTAGFIMLAQKAEETALQDLVRSLQERTRALNAYIGERRDDAQTLATDMRLTTLAASSRLHLEAGRAEMQDFLTTLTRGNVTSIALQDETGRILVTAGQPLEPRMRMPLADRDSIRAALLWNEANLLRFEVPLVLTGSATGKLIVETRFTLLDTLVADSAGLGETGDLRLCHALSSDELQCLPSRLNSEPLLSAPTAGASGPFPATLAIGGQSGSQNFVTLRNRQAIGAYGPLDGAGIGIVLLQDSEDIYAPMRGKLETLLIVLAMVTAGGIVLFRSQVAPLLRDARNSRSAAAASNSRTAAVMQSVPDGIITIDERGDVISVNPAITRMFGYDQESIVGQNIKMLMPPALHAAHDAGLARYVLTGDAHILGRGPVEVPALRSDGSEFPMELTLNSLWMNGQRYFVGIMHDITRRREADRLKDEFLAVVSHELRTPLTSIRGSLGLVKAGAAGVLSDKAQHLIDMAWRNTDRLASLINDILDIDKIESGHFKLELQRQALQPLLEQALEASTGYADTYKVRITLQRPVPELQVEVDAQRLFQVMANLLSNAAKFSPPGSEVRIEARRTGATCRISVHDHGPGISDEFRPRIFQRFSQADGSDGRQKGGTGLGLAISKALVERMGGVIGFDTTPAGATFYFDLPVHS